MHPDLRAALAGDNQRHGPGALLLPISLDRQIAGFALQRRTIDFYVDRYRRADCLLTLIAERHARRISAKERHGQAMIGRLQLVPALTKLEEGAQINLSTYATRADASERYFQTDSVDSASTMRDSLQSSEF